MLPFWFTLPKNQYSSVNEEQVESLQNRMIKKIKEINSNKDMSKHVTTLYYKDNENEWQQVNDYSPWIQYMSEDLQEALKSGSTLNDEQSEELKSYHKEFIYDPKVHEVDALKFMTMLYEAEDEAILDKFQKALWIATKEEKLELEELLTKILNKKFVSRIRYKY